MRPGTAASPSDGMCNVGVRNAELRKLGADRVSPLDTDRREHDLALPHLDVELDNNTHSQHNRQRQGQLVLGSELCQHHRLL